MRCARTSASYTTNSVGVDRWGAFFAGGAGNGAVSTACNDANESSAVTAAPPPTLTSPPPSSAPTPPTGSAGIAITKNPKEQTTIRGGAAKWTIVVTNPGNVTLTAVRVTDAAAPACARTSQDIPALASMAPGASVTYLCALTNVTTSFTNVAVDRGTPPTGPNVMATDTAHVTVKPKQASTQPAPAVSHPAISIRKEPKSQSIKPDGTATFQIAVTNTGDLMLHDVTVTDPRSPDCDRSLGTLAPAASHAYSCSLAGVTQGFDNVATATGTPPSGPSLTAHDQASVTVSPFKPPPVKKPPPAKHPKKHVKPQLTLKHHKPKVTG